MPLKNSLKQDVEESYYHIYSRGVNRTPIFLSHGDYVVFLSLLKRYLSVKPSKNENRVPYPHFYNEVELLAFCLMPTHFHLLVYQYNQTSMQNFMRALMTSYSMYFNKKYKRSGPVFEGRYRAVLIDSEPYIMHISRYIHLNPDGWLTYPYSSLAYYKNELSAEWLRPERIRNLFGSQDEYLNFVTDYEDYKKQLDVVKENLANA